MHRGMQPSREKHLAVKRSSDGRLSVQDIDCARVYHVNSVMEIRTQVYFHNGFPILRTQLWHHATTNCLPFHQSVGCVPCIGCTCV